MNTFRLIVATQHKENYGAHDWDGQGECPQYWKYKGGKDHVVSRGNLRRIARAWKRLNLNRFTTRSDYWEEYPIDIRILNPGEKTEDEEFREWEKNRGY